MNREQQKERKRLKTHRAKMKQQKLDKQLRAHRKFEWLWNRGLILPPDLVPTVAMSAHVEEPVNE